MGIISYPQVTSSSVATPLNTLTGFQPATASPTGPSLMSAVPPSTTGTSNAVSPALMSAALSNSQQQPGGLSDNDMMAIVLAMGNKSDSGSDSSTSLDTTA